MNEARQPQPSWRPQVEQRLRYAHVVQYLATPSCVWPHNKRQTSSPRTSSLFSKRKFIYSQRHTSAIHHSQGSFWTFHAARTMLTESSSVI
ncbi:hypothetical protein E2C01_065987 [Portunus trituberculatus]|uniref:Uncharacterized protein n=1 Tax=Portunus trituberculatus TaxID=210409 RepID=A0A5B7HKB1_PORTR|nr:hypothetical protein [Portunus trituberculatus]